MDLAKYFQTVWLPEYARSYLCDEHYSQQDLLAISREQYRRELDFFKAGPSLSILDTDGLVIRIWWLEKYGVCPEEITNLFNDQPPRLYLLATPDIPWEPDPLRESPLDRDRLFHIYENSLNELGFPYEVIQGNKEQRTVDAVAAISDHFS